MTRLLALVLALLACTIELPAQSSRTTLGALLNGPVDSLHLSWRMGGELGGHSFDLALARRGTHFTGQLRHAIWQTREGAQVGLAPASQPCDTTLPVRVSVATTRQVRALLARAELEPGSPRAQPMVTDVFRDEALLLWSRRDSVRITSARPVMVNGTPYRMLPGDWTRARTLLLRYAHPELEQALRRSCATSR